MPPPPFENVLVLTGPTGSGKTALAIEIAHRLHAEIMSMDSLGVELAQRLGAEIISMDSMALYRRLNIGTAKPTLLQRDEIPHHLIDVLDPWQSASVAWWLREAAICCKDISARGKQILFVGGTPLYLKALLFGLFDGPPADAALRERLMNEGERLGTAALHAQLAKVDPVAAARLHPNDGRRIIRALEVFKLTGKPISAWQSQWAIASPQNQGPPRVLWLDLPRQMLYERINRRVKDMFAAGLVDEVRALRELEKPLSREARQALGYKEVFAYLDGAASLAETIVRIQTCSRNFAKRQITWFRHLPGCIPATAQLTRTLWQPKMEV